MGQEQSCPHHLTVIGGDKSKIIWGGDFARKDLESATQRLPEEVSDSASVYVLSVHVSRSVGQRLEDFRPPEQDQSHITIWCIGGYSGGRYRFNVHGTIYEDVLRVYSQALEDVAEAKLGQWAKGE